MRRFILAAMLALAGPAAAQSPTPAREVTVANETDRILQELYLYRPGAEDGPDRLGSAVLPPRATLRIPLARGRDCAWEVRGVFEGGDEMRRRLDACRAPRATFAETGPRREVELVNQSDLSLREFYLAPPGRRGDWGEDRLGSTTVAAGENHRLRLRGTTACLFDLRAVFEDDSEEVRERQDLCRAPRLAFGDPSLPLREAVLTNRGRRTLREFYARPVGREAWGADRLGASVVEPRGEFRLRLRSRDCGFDLRAVFEDDREEVQRNLDLCTTRTLAFGAPVVNEGGARRVTLINGFSRTVQQAYLSPAESGDWGDDALGEAVLAPGARKEVSLEGGCHADLRIVFETEAAEERRDIDICAVTSISLRPGWTLEELVAPAPTQAGPQPGSIRLRNAAALPVVELYADAPGAARGADRLGATVLGAGESMDFAPPEGQCQADLTAVFRDGRELRLPEADLCAGREVVLQ
ncbi:hypothetical protein JMJ55_13725 [Belnapia sp. T6]|uniref:Uncharacterized protein n=1 Tax=Belnapia mucosa TaxID=2804532 RepID=A0ABS1V3W9_9PROT|nr:hypothetical protein [Belnapia mucosa]MBL6456388.1 hypothetical protein [Belnapia mucosa]